MPTVSEPKTILLGDSPTLRQIAGHHKVVKEAIYLYCSPENPDSSQRCASDPEEIRSRRRETLQEVNTTFTMSLFGAIEASFRADYYQRTGREQPMDDPVSRALLNLKEKKGEGFVSFKSIRKAWKDHHSNVPSDPDLWDDIHKAFEYRNWLAHGRCLPFEQNQRRQDDRKRYDFDTIYDLGCRIEATFPFLRP